MSETDDPLTPLDPAYVTASRIAHGLFVLPFVIGAGILEIAQLSIPGTFVVPVLLIAFYLAWVVPRRRYRHWGYDLGADRLRVVSGYMFHSDTVVPFGRIQHIDVQQGPIQRPYGISTLTVHTAGNHNSTVSLPGLRHEDALAMRETIRSHIRREAN